MLVTEYNKSDLQKRLSTEVAYVYPIFVDQHKHRAENAWSSLHVLFEDNTYYCIPYDHPDAISIEEDFSFDHKVITLHKKNLFSGNVIDLASILHLNGVAIPEERDFYTPFLTQLKERFKTKNLHKSVPLSIWMLVCKALLLRCKTLYNQYKDTEDTSAFKFINEITIPTLDWIECNGIWTTDSKYVFSSYNIHTATGRPSNAFGGINFAALNKNDGTREKFISRFGENGTLVQFDYEAFHLRLAGKLMGYELPTTSLHTYLAQQYYGTDDITEEQYNDSKARTFALMYGQTDDTGGVEFFQKMKEYSYKLWEEYRQNGFVLSETDRKVTVQDPNQSKVFNYLMQLTETEEAIFRVKDVCDFLGTHRSKVILYTYDAILLDVHNDELDFMENVSKLLSAGGFPIRQYRGDNYNNLILHKI